MARGQPYQEDPWQGIVNVAWPGGWGVLEVERPDSISILFSQDYEYIGFFAVGNLIPHSLITNNSKLYSITPEVDLGQIGENITYQYVYNPATAIDYSTISPPPDIDAQIAAIVANRDISAAADPDFFLKGEITCDSSWPQYPYGLNNSPYGEFIPPGWPHTQDTLVNPPSCGFNPEVDRTIFFAYWLGRTESDTVIKRIREFWFINRKELGSVVVRVTGPGPAGLDPDITGDSNIVARLRLYPLAAEFTRANTTISSSEPATYSQERSASYYQAGTLFSFGQGGFV